MPNVKMGNKMMKFPYTKEGKAAAAKAGAMKGSARSAAASMARQMRAAKKEKM